MVAPTTTASALVSAEQLEQFQRDGYCVVDGLYAPDELAAIEAFFEDFKHNGLAVYDAGHTFEALDKTKQQVRAMHPHRYSKQVQDWALHPRVVAALETLLGQPPLLAQTMYYFKPPGSKGQGMHQDNFYLLAAPATCIAAWTPIDRSDLDNGCLYVVPGSHRKEILCPADGAEAWLNYGDSHIKPFPRDAKPVPVIVEQGQTMFFGGNLIHGSGPNRTTDRSRRTFIGHYIDSASDQISRFYQPILDIHGQPVGRVKTAEGGGPCGDGAGGLH